MLSARNEVALARVAREVADAGGEAFVEAGDVTDEAHRRAIVDRALRERGRLDVLVNNAGRGYYAPVRSVDIGELEGLFALNVVAPLRLSQLALDALASSRGVIVMMSSVAGVLSAPRLGAYSASKFALEALSMSLRAEVKALGVRVVVVRPGPVDTPFRQNSIAPGGRAGVRPPGTTQTAEAVAKKTLRAVDRSWPVVETSLFVRAASAAARIAPASLRWVSGLMATRQL